MALPTTRRQPLHPRPRASAKAQPASTVRPAKRSFRIAGHQTSLSLEGVFWDALKQAAADRGTSQASLIAEIDAARGATNLSSAVRVWLFEDLRQRKLSPPA